ncbi:arsenate reductase ArsC [Truepera radiovictrix]|uniref:Protein-tyrosine phosphatase, low molecular weight n=1 Tax=Truepera radiovictrix (strain DSM 17093 / CIP 108686 / LMG 22925 / RQ-24) TaxID=649638 RepID=D7CRT9_TRURR|nr:arsenate reductase ArsC [Truepera radiovictrix]ADI15267.1 Protein-tyrosine phosphatase, low molecular weight [Truepera radiovictrix DSM 17093]WMT56182.1 arsenate reductase ArsC [Truepera radiovictrix]
MNGRKTHVLFLCTGNSARSLMAEAFVNEHAGERFVAHSAGLQPKGVNPYTVRVMAELGISLEGARSKSVREFLGRERLDYVITVCGEAEANCPRVFPGTVKYRHWSFEDPAAFEGPEAATLETFREVRDEIRARVQAWLQETADVPV